jgi:hypothetical protein
MKEYLGDGVYVDCDARGLILTTEDGIRATNTIVLDLEVMMALRDYMERTAARFRIARTTDVGGAPQ